VDVGRDGTTAAFSSYINNLHPEDHAQLYSTLAGMAQNELSPPSPIKLNVQGDSDIFGRFVPLFERVLTDLRKPWWREMSGDGTFEPAGMFTSARYPTISSPLKRNS
jgi:hypothetical protein